MTGDGVKKDLEAGIHWMRKAALKGHPEAQYNLALAYGCGDGVQQSQRYATIWLGKAAENGNLDARRKLKSARRKAKTA